MAERPIDIVQCTFSPTLWHRTPYLVVSLELKNDTTVGKYLFPGIATLELFGEVVTFAVPTVQSPGSHQSGPWGATFEGAGVGQAYLYWRSGSTRRVYCSFEIGAMQLKSLADSFESRDTGPYRLQLELGVVEEQSVVIRTDPNGPARQEAIPKSSEGIFAYVEGHFKAHEWREWMKAWGVASEAIYIPTQLAVALRRIQLTMGVGFEWEVISELLKSYRGSQAEAFLVTTEDRLQATMAQLIADAAKEVKIMCRALDETLLDALAEAVNRGVEVKVVTVPTEKLKQEKYPETTRLAEAVRKVSSMRIQLKTNPKQHSRIIVSERAALVGSADPDYYGLKVHRNASIYTTNPTVVNAAMWFFDKLWEESEAPSSAQK